jgi:Na+/proline symporter
MEATNNFFIGNEPFMADKELPVPGAKGFHWADYVVFALFLLVTLGIGMGQGIAETFGCLKKQETTTAEFLTGNRSFSIWPVALSMLSAFLSAILILGTPAEVYVEGTEYWVYVLGMMAACVFATLLFVPLLYPLKLTSSYEVQYKAPL